MAAPTITTARAQEADLSHAGINEPSMEDILASIRRIIAEDQSSSLGRSGIGGLTRRIATAQAEVAQSTHLEPAAEIEPDTATYESDTEVEAEPQPHVYEAKSEPALGALSHEQPAVELETLQQNETTAPSEDVATVEAMVYQPPTSPEPAQQTFESEPLVSPAIGASITSSFQTLAESVMLQDPDLIERVMRDQMRPLLKAWLDDHLPSIVERLVRAEIERVARGGRARNT